MDYRSLKWHRHKETADKLNPHIESCNDKVDILDIEARKGSTLNATDFGKHSHFSFKEISLIFWPPYTNNHGKVAH